MKILILLFFSTVGIAAFSQQSNQVKTEQKAEASKTEQSKTVEAKKIKTISAADAKRIPKVQPGKRNSDPIKKD